MTVLMHNQEKRYTEIYGGSFMTSRERVLASINHKEPDRVAVDLGATPSSNISAVAYNNLKKHLGMTDGHTRTYDVVQQVVQPEDAIIERFGIDVLDLGRMFNNRDEDWYDYRLADGSTAQYPKWFKPDTDDEGNVLSYHEDGTLIAKMPVGATFLTRHISLMWTDIPLIMRA